MTARAIVVSLCGLLVLIAPASAQTLIGFGSLPTETYSSEPTSGQFIGPANGITTPFRDQQQVQGFSAVLQAPNGDLWVLPDNGFGAKVNSADWVLRLYRVTPDLKTTKGGTGTIRVQSYITLRDPVPAHRVSDRCRRRDLSRRKELRSTVDPVIKASTLVDRRGSRHRIGPSGVGRQLLVRR